MVKKNWLVFFLIFACLGTVTILPADADGSSQEIARVQRAIAAEKLDWQADVTPLSLLSRGGAAEAAGRAPA